MRRLLSVFFAFSLLLTTAVGGVVSLPASCPQEACCCGGDEPRCPPATAPESNCGKDQIPSPTSCGRGQAPLQTARLPQAPYEVEAVKTAGDPYASPWPPILDRAVTLFIEARESSIPLDADDALERAPDRLSKLRILRI